MPILDQVRKKPEPRPPVTIIYGPPKVGKTTFACSGPNTLLLDIEDGASEIACDRIKITDWPHLRSVLLGLCQEQHPYTTVVIDSLDHLEQMIHEFKIKEAGKSSLNELGAYGMWRGIVLDGWIRLMTAMDVLRQKGIAPVLLAHTHTKEVEDPISGSYSQHQLKMDSKAGAFCTEKADVIAFMAKEVSFTSSKDDSDPKAGLAKSSDLVKLRLRSGEPGFVGGCRLQAFPSTYPVPVGTTYADFLRDYRAVQGK